MIAYFFKSAARLGASAYFLSDKHQAEFDILEHALTTSDNWIVSITN
jgi:hypothetical protein